RPQARLQTHQFQQWERTSKGPPSDSKSRVCARSSMQNFSWNLLGAEKSERPGSAIQAANARRQTEPGECSAAQILSLEVMPGNQLVPDGTCVSRFRKRVRSALLPSQSKRVRQVVREATGASRQRQGN